MSDVIRSVRYQIGDRWLVVTPNTTGDGGCTLELLMPEQHRYDLLTIVTAEERQALAAFLLSFDE